MSKSLHKEGFYSECGSHLYPKIYLKVRGKDPFRDTRNKGRREILNETDPRYKVVQFIAYHITFDTMILRVTLR